MAQIRMYQQTQGIPSTTGTPNLPAVPVQDHIGESLFSLGSQFSKIGENLQLAQDNREVTSSTLSATIKLNDLQSELSKVDGALAISQFQSRSDGIFNEISEGMNTRTQDAFAKNFQRLSAKSQIAIKSAGVVRWRENLEGGMEQGLAGLVRLAGNAEILDDDGSMSIVDILKTGEQNIDKMVESGVIAADVGSRRKLKFRKNVAGAGVNSRIRSAPMKDLGNLVEEMRNDEIADPEIKNYWDQMNETEKLSFQTRVLRTYETQLNIFDKNEKKKDAALKLKYSQNFRDTMKDIILAKHNPENNEMPTKVSILEALHNKQIGWEDYQKLTAELINADPPESNPDYIKDVRQRLRNAPNKEVIEEIIVEMEGKLGSRGDLTETDFRVLEQRAEQAKTRTPAVKRANVYSNALDNIVAKGDFLDTILGSSAKQRAQFVVINFEALLASGTDPAEAFITSLEAFNTRGRIELNAIPKPQFGPDKQLSEWTLEDVENSRERLKVEYKGKADLLASQTLILNSLASYLAADAKAKAEATEAAAAAEHAAKLAEQEGGSLQNFWNTFTGQNEDEDGAKTVEERLQQKRQRTPIR